MSKEIEEIRHSIQEGLEDYILKTDLELIKSIIDFGCGELEFHTTDIERLIRENKFRQQKIEQLEKEVDKAKSNWVIYQDMFLEEYKKNTKLKERVKELCNNPNCDDGIVDRDYYGKPIFCHMCEQAD